MAASGILLVDKPGGVTSHDVVARARRALGTRKIGHAGTLDPMATGLLVLGVEGATRLLTYFVGLDKTYEATIRLGVATTTDDADGEETERADAAALAAVTPQRVAAGVAALTGRIRQVPSTVSAIKVDGRRAYDRARAGEEVVLKAREVTVSRFDVVAQRPSTLRQAQGGAGHAQGGAGHAQGGAGHAQGGAGAGGLDLDVVVDCSSGTYIRALARDLGAALGVGGHLTALRRTRVGPLRVEDAAPDVAAASLLSPAVVAASVLGRLDVAEPEARDLRHGKRLVGAAGRLSAPQAAAIAPDGELVGIVERRGDDLKSAMNMPGGLE
ncbi:MAG: tRNA pseudouridine(55) synthase TruB [Microbacterium sp.]|uniref:tRNA pseudouridine(55) synthase TruB n=1 Tax=Microbacterium sp. TaxID=51671 RepID=UPI0039E608D4